jgi:hypothetical protein
MMRPALLLFFLVLTACGSGGGSGSGGAPGACASHGFVGVFKQNAATARMTFKRDCSGTEAVDCGLVYTYRPVTDQLADMTLTVTASNGGGACLSVGSHQCDWSVPTNGQVNLNCGLGSVTYSQIEAYP